MLRFIFKFTMLTYLPLLLVDEHGLSLTEAGVVLGVSALTAAVASTQVARLLRNVRPSVVVAGALAAIGTALAAFAFVDTWFVAIVVGMAFGAGDGTVSVIQDALRHRNPNGRRPQGEGPQSRCAKSYRRRQPRQSR